MEVGDRVWIMLFQHSFLIEIEKIVGDRVYVKDVNSDPVQRTDFGKGELEVLIKNFKIHHRPRCT